MNWLNPKYQRSYCAALALTALTAVPAALSAQEITLKSNDGTIELKGELLNFDGNFFLLDTPSGELQVSAAMVTCEGGGCPAPDERDDAIVIAGSGAMARGLVPILLAGYAGFLNAEERVTGGADDIEISNQFVGDEGFGEEIATFKVRASISSDAFSNLLGQSAQIGLSSRRIEPVEARALSKYGSGSMINPANEHIVAVDSIVLITHPDNPVNSISLDQVRDVFSGEITNWSELGGADAPINTVQLLQGSGTRSVFQERVFGDVVPNSPPSVVTAESSTEVAAQVNADVNAIGYVSFAFQRGAQAMTLTNSCGIASVPDAFSARTGEYELGRSLYFYASQQTINEDTQALLDYVNSGAADSVIQKSGFIDLGIDRLAQQADSPRAIQLQTADVDAYERGIMNDMLARMAEFDRLSSTFRFRTGSDSLTPRGRVDLERLATYLKNQPAGTEVALVGFTDDQGTFDGNRDLAAQRADQVAAELQSITDGALDGLNITTLGYGPIAPVACNASAEGRAINRRVEVWIK